VIAGVLLIIPFAVAVIGQRVLVGRAAAMRAYPSQAFAGVAPEEIVVALSHHPEFFPIAAASGAQLTLASHTHGGQVSLFGRPLIKAYDYATARLKTAARLSTSPPGQVTGCLFGSLRRGRSSSSPFGGGDSGGSAGRSPGFNAHCARFHAVRSFLFPRVSSNAPATTRSSHGSSTWLASEFPFRIGGLKVGYQIAGLDDARLCVTGDSFDTDEFLKLRVVSANAGPSRRGPRVRS